MNVSKAQFYDQSAIRIERHGRSSMTGNTRHVNNRYFWIKDRADKGEIKIMYCPTELMLADFFTKPLQGNMFRRFRKIIMGYESIDTILAFTNPIKERVGDESESMIEYVIESKDKENSTSTVVSEVASYADVVRGKINNVNRAIGIAH